MTVKYRLYHIYVFRLLLCNNHGASQFRTNVGFFKQWPLILNELQIYQFTDLKHVVDSKLYFVFVALHWRQQYRLRRVQVSPKCSKVELTIFSTFSFFSMILLKSHYPSNLIASFDCVLVVFFQIHGVWKFMVNH